MCKEPVSTDTIAMRGLESRRSRLWKVGLELVRNYYGISTEPKPFRLLELSLRDVESLPVFTSPSIC